MEIPVLVAPYQARAKWPIYEFKGTRFYWRAGYYKAGFSLYLHRAVYEANFAAIPPGWHVHHKDRDRANNQPENLECLAPDEHGAHHMEDDGRKISARRAIRNAIEAAAVWRRQHPEAATEIGKRGARSLFERLAVRGKDQLICSWCEKPYEGYKHLTKRRFCGASCQGQARKASLVDDVDCLCAICGAPFRTNKYQGRKTCSRACLGAAISRARLQSRSR